MFADLSKGLEQLATAQADARRNREEDRAASAQRWDGLSQQLQRIEELLRELLAEVRS